MHSGCILYCTRSKVSDKMVYHVLVMERKKNHQNVVSTACRRLRTQHGWTQSEMVVKCQLMGWMLSRATLAKIEAGFRHANDAEVALLARVFQTTADELLDCPLPVILSAARHSPDSAVSEEDWAPSTKKPKAHAPRKTAGKKPQPKR